MDENKILEGRLFWPILLIGVGIVLLLSNLGLIEPVSFILLLRMWPLVLVAIGLQILFGRDAPWVGSLIAAGVVIAALVLLVYAPDLGFKTPSPELITENFGVSSDGVDEADIHIDTDRGSLSIFPLEGSDHLIEIEVTHNEQVRFEESGTRRKNVNFVLNDLGGFDFGNFIDVNKITTEIGLSTRIPIALNLDHGSGSADLNLSSLELIRLEVDNGSGSLDVILPPGAYPTLIDTGSGSLRVETERNVDLDLEADIGSGRVTFDLAEGVTGHIDINSGSGTVTVYLPEGVGVWVSGSTGSGSVTLPRGFYRTRGSDSPGSQSGTWQSPDFDNARDQLFIEFSVGSGNIRFLMEN